MPPAPSIPSEIAGYTVLSLSLPPLPSLPTGATHYLYIHPHQPKIPIPTAPRSLFLVNIPFDSTVLHIKHLLSQQIGLPAGRIEEVQFEGEKKKGRDGEKPANAEQNTIKQSKKRKRGSDGSSLEDFEGAQLPPTWDREIHTKDLTCVVLFVDRPSMEAALKAVKKAQKEKKAPIWGEGVEDKVPPLGSARYLMHDRLTFPNKATILESVNAYMSAYAAKEAAQAKVLARQRQEVDADGFVTVTRGGRTNPAKQEAAKEQAEKLKEKQTGLEDFYRFQSREKRKERAGELVRKFEEDREKVRKMKERRGRFRASLEHSRRLE